MTPEDARRADRLVLSFALFLSALVVAFLAGALFWALLLALAGVLVLWFSILP